MNPLLARQLRRLKLDENTPPDAQTWSKLVSRLDSVFKHSDQTLARLDRSLKLSSEEMQNIYETLRENEHKIQQQRDQLDAVLEAVQAGVCAVSSDGEVLFINRGGRALLDIHGAASAPHASTFLPQFRIEEQTLNIPRAFSLLKKNPAVFFEHCTLHKSNQSIPVSVHLSTLEKDDAENASKGFVVIVFQDITERLHAEEVKQQAQKMEVIANLIGGIAHELNNMLASITGNLFLAKSRLAGRDDVIKRLDVAERLSFDMGNIISHLMAFSGQSIVSKKAIDFREITTLEINRFKQTVPNNVVLNIQICDETLGLFGAEEQLQQLLVHLLQNALDASVPSSVLTIQVHLEHFVADKDFCNKHQVSNQNFARLCVQDNGCGIGEHTIPHIFEPFFTGKRFGKGKGLGLSMVQGTVQMHGGLIEVESQTSAGTTFSVYLPLEQQNNAYDNMQQNTGDNSPQTPSLSHHFGKAVLLVEDNAIVQDVAQELLLSLDHEVFTANDGVEAVEIYQAEQENIGLILMDIMMPRMNGKEACVKIRAINPDAKVIFLSGYDQHSTQLNALGLENELFLSKPYNITQLSAMIACELEIG